MPTRQHHHGDFTQIIKIAGVPIKVMHSGRGYVTLQGVNVHHTEEMNEEVKQHLIAITDCNEHARLWSAEMARLEARAIRIVRAALKEKR